MTFLIDYTKTLLAATMFYGVLLAGVAACDEVVTTTCVDGAECYPTAEGYRLTKGREPCGICRTGRLDCSEDVCVGAVAPSDEVCNGLDDDCDCETDEGLTLPSGDPRNPCPQEACGPCSASASECINGVRICTGVPEPEECDLVDNDCNCAVDDIDVKFSYSGPPQSAGNGPCRPRVEACVDGRIVVTDEVLPADKDQCYNDEDDDCDGQTDEADEPVEPRSVALLLDLSGSMSDDLSNVRDIICDYAPVAPPDVFMAVVGIAVQGYPSGVVLLEGFTTPANICAMMQTTDARATGNEHQPDAFVAASMLPWPSLDRAAIVLSDEEVQPALYDLFDVQAACLSYSVDLYVATDPMFFDQWDQTATICGGEVVDLHSYSDLSDGLLLWFRPEC